MSFALSVKRLIVYESPETNGIRALCLEIHDLWLSKAAANRPKDWEFCHALIKRKLVSPETLRKRLKTMKLPEELSSKIQVSMKKF